MISTLIAAHAPHVDHAPLYNLHRNKAVDGCAAGWGLHRAR